MWTPHCFSLRIPLVGVLLVGVALIFGSRLSWAIQHEPVPPVPGDTEIEISLKPSQGIKQGTPVIMSVKSAKPLPTTFTVELENIRATGFRDNQNPQEGVVLLGIPVDQALGSFSFRLVDSHREPMASGHVTIQDAHYLRQNISVGKKTAGLTPIAGELEAIQGLKNKLTATQYWKFPFISPTPDCQSSPFGVKRYHNGVYIHDYHKGVDLKSPSGRPVKAITGGVVQIATTSYRLHGGTVGLDHGLGLTSIYIHLSKVAVKPGQVVKQGDVIGSVGSTGFATGPHLHWGLFVNQVPVNPNVWIPVKSCG